MSGGFNPSPRRSGAAEGSIYEVLQEAVVHATGTAVADDADSYAYAESLAYSRAIAALFEAIQRLAYQWDPTRMSDFLGRWEAILGIVPPVGATIADRRRAVGVRFALVGVGATIQGLTDYIVSLIGDLFVEIKNGDSATAVQRIPGGVTIPSGPTIPDGQFASSVAFVGVHIEPTSGMNDQAFYDAAGSLRALDTFVPAWADWGWFRHNGHAGGGFFLDETNLDNEAFR